MSKTTRRERKALTASKQEGYSLGYAEGYAKGLHDGNPFNAMIEALSSLANNVSEAIKKHPELLAELNKPDTDDEDVDAVQDSIDALGYPYSIDEEANENV